MKIVVINGSPKGLKSVTMQHVKYMELVASEHDFVYESVCQRIKQLERDIASWEDLMERLRNADLILWASPVYFLLVPSGLKRFIELIFERGTEDVFKGKHAGILTTSIHFFDHTSVGYLWGICDDLKMQMLETFPADMHEMLTPQGRVALKQFLNRLLQGADRKEVTFRRFAPALHSPWKYRPADETPSISYSSQKIVIVTDHPSEDTNLARMVHRLTQCLHPTPEVIQLHDLQLKGQCLGCLKCGSENQCVYKDRDDFFLFFEEHIKNADVLFFAGSIHDRYLSSLWKLVFDRSFYNNHKSVLANKQIGYLLSGPMQQLPLLVETLSGWIEVQHANGIGFLSDECQDNAQLDKQIVQFARQAVEMAESHYKRPMSFLGFGGHKVFRDAIDGGLLAVFPEDHKHFKANQYYDYPRSRWWRWLQFRLMYTVLRIPILRKKFQENVKTLMLQEYEKILQQETKRRGK